MKATRFNLLIKSIKIVIGFDIHTLESEGAVFSQKKKQRSAYK
jgi:hypothetical protein